MRIGIDLTSWSNPRGYGRFTRGVVTALLDRETGHQVLGFVDAQTAAAGGLPTELRKIVADTRESPTRAATATGRRSIRDLRVMAGVVAAHPVDVFFFPTLYTWFPVRGRARVALGIHDVIAEEYPELVFPDRHRRRLWGWKSRLARHGADAVVTVSAWSARGIVERLGWPAERVWVVDEAPDPVFRPVAPAAIRRDLLARRGVAVEAPFVLFVGGMNPHKNLVRLVDALAAVRSGGDDLRLVLVGDAEADAFTPGVAELRRRVAGLGLEAAVVFAGRVPDDELVHFYAAARAVVLPSRAEGFGLPAVEGAACGTPALATRNSPLPEILAGGGVFFDPVDEAAIAGALRVALDPVARERLGAGARAAAAELSWDRSAGALLECLEAVAPCAATTAPPGFRS